MEKKDYFISYNKTNKDWAKWIGGTLEENGYSVYLQAWDIAPGNDFIKRMNDFLEYSKNYIAVYSQDFYESEYCMKEFQTAFNAHINKEIEKFIPIRLEDVKLGTLYKTTVYIDLFDLTEEKATKALLNGIGHTANPRNKGKYPGKTNNEIKNNSFPGNIKNDRINYREILILEKDKNKKGDIFNRLIFDVFHALGFDEFQYNVQKTGREIDMVLKHRTENRVALVECKAQKDPVGGDAINKFVGALDVERKKYKFKGIHTVGYFVSKSGFKVTAIEQENERSRFKSDGEENIILLGTNEIIRELISGNMICSLEKAIDAVKKDNNLCLCKDVDLIACEYGWIWVLYYSNLPKQKATHFAFVHADGNPLLNEIANNILKSNEYSSYFSNLSYIESSVNKNINKKAAKNAYFKYLEKELGEIQFEGMPTDKEAGSVKVELENIFVPLGYYKNDDKNNILTIDDVLSSNKVAILAKPGGGKSTLIRRIALAYAYPSRRMKVDDGLPNKEWFPIYIRCRDLGEEANNGVLEIISSIVKRAEIRIHKHAFDSIVEDYLQNGNVLLLIDGLDEIANEKNRISFVNQLRTFVAIYPTTRLLITSREAGFRAVANTLSGYCANYSIANLQEEQIRKLSLKWHQAILGECKEAEIEAKKVCDIILADDRIMSLAQNPLLLTTLLFVKRWVGYLPTKKCQLYEEMIKLLLVTWNAVAHEKLDMDETEPQLAYIAYRMTLQGKQKITKDKLAKYIIEARKELPELLGYTTLSPSKFIEQVEERSSLLIQLGLEEDKRGKLVPSYEFSHLSFQEYLTAKAVVEGWIPDADKTAIKDVVNEHLLQEHWKEVIPMIAVLSGRQSRIIIESLLQECENLENRFKNGIISREELRENIVPFHLANCVASEVPISVDMLEKAINFIIKGMRSIDRIIIRNSGFFHDSSIYDVILKSKYGEKYSNIINNKLFEDFDKIYLYEYCNAWLRANLHTDISLQDIAQHFNCSENKEHIKGSLLMMNYSFRYARPTIKKSSDNENKGRQETVNEKYISTIFNKVYELLKTDDILSLFSASWCLAWSGYNEIDIIPSNLYDCLFERLLELWESNIVYNELERTVSWALRSIMRPDLQINNINCDKLIECIDRKYSEPKNKFDVEVSTMLAFLTGHCGISETVERICQFRKSDFIINEKVRFWKEIAQKNKSFDKELKKNKLRF